jgi:hypothetical protein
MDGWKPLSVRSLSIVVVIERSCCGLFPQQYQKVCWAVDCVVLGVESKHFRRRSYPAILWAAHITVLDCSVGQRRESTSEWPRDRTITDWSSS